MIATNYELERCNHCNRIMIDELIKIKFEGTCIKINGSLCQRCNIIVEKLIDRLDHEIIN